MSVKGFHELDPSERPKGEVIQHDPPVNERSLARRISLQILYEVDSAGHPPGSVTAIHLQARDVPRKAARYVRQLVSGVVEHRAALDRAIQRYAPEWPIEQMAIVDRNVLRLAILEFAVFQSTPVSVAIDEAVQLAKLFGAESSPGFVNGVLGALSEDEALIAALRAPRAKGEETSE
nr:MAG: transcription antitermination factor NusB [Chloroflexota bacterium]